MAKIKTSDKSENYRLYLFVAGGSGQSLKAIEMVSKICITLSEPYELSVFDVRKNPAEAVRQNIVAVPTLLKLSPQPRVCIVGDMANASRVLGLLKT